MKSLRFIAFYLVTCGVFMASSYATPKNSLTNTPGTEKWDFNSTYDGQDMPIMASPVIGKDKKIYIMNDLGIIYALNPNGTIAWKKNLIKITQEWWKSGALCSQIAIGQDGTVYVGIYYFEDDAKYYKLYALDRLNGTIKWTFNFGDGAGNTHIAIAHDGNIYANAQDALYAISPSGSLKWKAPFDKGTPVESVVVGSNGDIFLTAFYYGKGESLYSLDPKKRTIKWNVQLGGPAASNLAIDSKGNIVLFVLKSAPHGNFLQELNVFSPAGKLVWQKNFTGINQPTSSPVIGQDGTIYFTVSFETGKNVYRAKLYAVDQKGYLKWSSTDVEGDDWLDSPAIDAKRNIICPIWNRIYAMTSTGEIKWIFAGDDLFAHITIDSNGTVYTISGSHIYAINSSSTGLDPLAPWPKYNKDIYNSGNAGFSSK